MAYKGVDKYVTLQLARFQAIAQSLVLIVTPMTVDQFQGRQGKTAPTLSKELNICIMTHLITWLAI